jgi:hypothetical protein
MLDALSIPEREYARVPRYGGWPSQSKEKVGTEGTVFTPRLINRSHAADGICADRRSCVSARNVVAVLCSSCTQRADACAALGGERAKPCFGQFGAPCCLALGQSEAVAGEKQQQHFKFHPRAAGQGDGMGWDGAHDETSVVVGVRASRRPPRTHARTHGTVSCSALTGACLLDSSLIRGERGRGQRQ